MKTLKLMTLLFAVTLASGGRCGVLVDATTRHDDAGGRRHDDGGGHGDNFR